MNKKDANLVLRDVNCLGSKPDFIEIEIEEGFFYKITKEDENNININTGWNKDPKQGWIPLKKAQGEYCGYNSITDNDFHLKIRIKDPFSLTSFYGNYVVLCVSNLLSIKKILKACETEIAEIPN